MKLAERTQGVKIRWSSDRLSLRQVGGGSPLTAVKLKVLSNIDRISQTKSQNIRVWPSPVRRLSGGQKIAGSNPAILTKYYLLVDTS